MPGVYVQLAETSLVPPDIAFLTSVCRRGTTPNV
jgi:hypothetical protein